MELAQIGEDMLRRIRRVTFFVRLVVMLGDEAAGCTLADVDLVGLLAIAVLGLLLTLRLLAAEN